MNVDFPAWVVGALDAEADRIGVPRQSLIKMWIVERMERAGGPTPALAAPVVAKPEVFTKTTHKRRLVEA